MLRVCIILPALNEEQTVGKVIDDIPRKQMEKRGCQVQVVVVDNNCTDRTRQVAESRNARVITENRPGKGRAVRTALELCRADYYFLLDADYTYSPVYIQDMLKILVRGCPVVIGSRLKGGWEKGAFKPLNIAGNILLTTLASILYQIKISDVCTGFWGIRGEIVPALDLSADGFQFEADLFSQLARKNLRIAEVPIYYRRRVNQPKLVSIRDGLKIGWTLVSRRFFQPAGRSRLASPDKSCLTTISRAAVPSERK